MVAGASRPGEERELQSRLTGVASALGEYGHDSTVTPLQPDTTEPTTLCGELAFLCPSGDGKRDLAAAALLEAAGARIIGPKRLSLALSYDALKVRELLRVYNVATAPYYRAQAMHQEKVSSAHGSFGFPAFVCARDGAYGQHVNDLFELAEALGKLGSGEGVVERAHGGDRVGVAVLHGRALGMIDLEGEAVASCLPSARRGGIYKVAERTAEALEANGAALVMLGVSERANEHVLDVDVCPELSARSAFVRTARDAGYCFGEICDLLVRQAWASMGERPGMASRRPPARQFEARAADSAEGGSEVAVAALAQTG